MTRTMSVHVLTNPMTTQNVRGFLTPLLLYRSQLRALGIYVRVFTHEDPAIAECDALLVNAKYYGERWNVDPVGIVEALDRFRNQGPAVFYCDNYDSTAPIRTEVLPVIDVYFKNMLLKDRDQYQNAYYGGRIHTDYYHRLDGTTDSTPQISQQITAPEERAKLQVSWNFGLAHYGLVGSRIAQLYGTLPHTLFLRAPFHFAAPNTPRPHDVSCRITTRYARETVARHRILALEALGDRVPEGRVNRLQFSKELRRSKIVISPFGWGEFSLRDFETLLAGAILCKPNMDHLDTYPNFYRTDETYLAFRWDFTDINDVIGEALENYAHARQIAEEGQRLYRYHLTDESAHQEFCIRFRDILARAIDVRRQSAV